MIVLEGRVQTSKSAEEAFAYVADFQYLSEWDPGIVLSKSLTPGPLSPYQRFEVHSRFFGQTVSLDYTLTELSPRFARYEGKGAGGLEVVDLITVSSTDGDTVVHWRAEMNLGTLSKPFSPVVRRLMQRVANHAMSGMAKALNGQVLQ